MHQIARLIDADTSSLAARVLRTVERDGSDCVVTYFTYWYTGRPPVHEAIVERRAAAA
jgi:hypothetical protein